jgi:hypothetical protein
MRFMIAVKATKDSEAGKKPEEKLFAAMATYHEALAKAGVLLDASGLQPTSKPGVSSTQSPMGERHKPRSSSPVVRA